MLDENGAPVAAVRVAVGKPRERAFGGFVGFSRPAYADERGYYEIRNVPPGEWFVNAQGAPILVGPQVSADFPEYEPTYFPGVVDPTAAQLITVRPGDTIDNVTFSIQRAARYTLRVPVDVAELDPASVQIILMGANGLNTHTITSAAVGDDGQFALNRLTPGNYLFWVRCRTSTGIYAGVREIAIGADMLEPPLSLRATATIAGRIIGDNGETELPTGLRVSAPVILEHNLPASFPLDGVDVSADGRFALQGLFGRRGLRINGLPDPWSVRRLVVGGQELPPTAVIDLRSGQTLDATFVVGRDQ